MGRLARTKNEARKMKAKNGSKSKCVPGTVTLSAK
jgi:hypothetical protein